MKILCMGQITYDYSLPIDGFPIEGLKYELKEKIENSGGSACNMAYALAKWNEEVYLSAAVGGDELGNKIKKDLSDAGVKTHTVETVFESKTPIEFVLINKTTGNKTVFSICEKEPHVKKYEFDFIPEIILLDGYEYTSGISVVNKYPNAITILDAGDYTKSNVELCKYAKYIIASQRFVEGYTGVQADFSNPTTLLDLYKKFATKYPNSNVVVTLKNHGAMYLDNNQIKVMPGLKLESIKDSTAAGDIFRAAFALGLSRKYEMEKIIRIANIASGLSLSKIGGKESVPLFSDIAKYYESKFGSIEAAINNSQPNSVSQQTSDVQTNNQTEQNTTTDVSEEKVMENEVVSSQSAADTVVETPSQEVINNDGTGQVS